MREACSRATRSSDKHARFAHVDRLVPGKQRSDSTVNLSSSDAAQLDDGQVLASRAVLDRKFEPRTATPIDLRMRPSAGRAARPSTSWLETRSEARGRSSEVDLVRRAYTETGVWSVFVVPVDEVKQLAPEDVALVGDQHAARALALHRTNEPLDHRDASVLTNRAEPLLDASTATPPTEPGVGELRSLVRDQVSWGSSCVLDGAAEEPTDLDGRRHQREHGDAHGAAGIVIDVSGHPILSHRGHPR